MLIDSSFKGAISKAFFDKTFTLQTRTHGVDQEGGATTSVTGSIEPTGNVQFTLNARAIETYGITAKVDIAITVDPSVAAVIDDSIIYNGIEYVVSDVKPRDSHTLIVGTRR